MHSRNQLAAPRPIRTVVLPLLKPKCPNPFLPIRSPREEPSREEQQVQDELAHILTLPVLSSTRRRPSPDFFGLPYKKTPSPGFKRPPSRPLHNPLSKDESFQQLSNISEASTCSSSEEALRNVH